MGSTKRQSCKRYILTISKCTFPVPRHKNEIKVGTLDSILKAAGLK
ncbi:type II toxin-antitoxin system HicA family toxin [Emergencia timonensis]|uniref:Type II toxin-antitoxin system HicA family toxin n=1 Tax=Emergencia timonensis TaxID=1776384 RepID=A0A415E812_9FIRM|nr:type II toxin-antitoxin system HicA family toxin [Clostridiales bacterium]RHJ89943.1 type II toxin-antitoxin system HicA family toxin [Emergencia timonensis]